MIRRTSFALLTAAVLAAPAAPARAADQEVVEALVGSEAEARADWDAWLAELVSAVARSPESPWSQGALWKIEALLPSVDDAAVVERSLDPVLAAGVRDGDLEEHLRDLLAARARMRGDFAASRAYDADRGYLTRFAVIGPFGWSDSALVHRPYPPEAAEVDPRASHLGAQGEVRWVPMAQLGGTGWVDPSEQIRQGEGVVYAMARVRVPEARDVAFKTHCRNSFAIFVNGERVEVADRERDAVPATVWSVARLVPGWNRVVVKVAGSAPFALKLADPRTGRPLEGYEVGDPLQDEPAPAAAPAAGERAYRTPVERVLADRGDPLRDAAAAFMAERSDRPWDAYAAYEAASSGLGAARGAAAANVNAAHGRFLAGFDALPPVQRKLRAKERFAAALEARPAHASATVRLAEYEDEDDRPDKALRMLQEHVAEHPSGTAFMALARIALRRHWENEAVAAAEAALARNPHDREALVFLADLDRRYGNHEAYRQRLARLLEADAADGQALDRMADQLRAEGRHEEALALARRQVERWPGSIGARIRVAELLRALGRVEESLAANRELERIVPREERHPREIAELLEVAGRREEALAAYRRSLERQPFQPAVWRAVARLEGGEADFAAAYEPQVDELIASLATTEDLRRQYPKAVAITVLDHQVTRVRPDGSSESYVHMVYKLLDEKGVEKYSDLPNQGDLIEVRAILPDGTVMKPTGLAQRNYNMEGLVPGTVVDHRYVHYQRAGRRGFDVGGFYFQDTELRGDPNPVLLSRWVVLAPEGMKLPVSTRNFDGEPRVETRDGVTATVWEKRDMPRIDYEQHMPPPDEIVPIVEYVQPRSFEDANWVYLARRAECRPTPLVAAAAAEVLREGMGDVEKAQALYAFVNREIKGEMGAGRGPTAILLEKAGSRSQLLEALLRVADVPYRNARAAPWDGGGRDFRQPDYDVFATEFLWIEPRGAEPFPLFVMGRYAPFGLVPPYYRGSAAFLASEQGGRIFELPAGGPPMDETTRFEIRLGAAPEDTTLAGSILDRTERGYRWKQAIAEISQDQRKKYAEQRISQLFAQPTLTGWDYPGLEEYGTPLEIRLEGRMPNYLTRQGDVFVASLGLPPTSMTDRFVDRPAREYDLVLDVHDDRYDEYVVHLGDAFDVRKLPEDHLAIHELGTYSLTFREEDGRVVVRRERHLHPARYRPDEYKGFVAWCKEIDEAEERKIELRRLVP